MDKVLKQRLVGASILIALAVIFLPMLFDGGTDERADQRELALELPDQPSDERRVRRLALDPERVREEESASEPPGPGLEEPVAESAPQVAASRESTPPEVPQEDSPADPAVTGSSRDETEDRSDQSGAPATDVDPEASPGTAPEAAAPATEEEAASGPAADPEPAQEDSPPGTTLDDGWSVQVAVFSNRETAESIVEQLEGLGHEAGMDRLVRDQATLYRLRTGPYPSRAAAQRALDQINATIAGVNPELRAPDGDDGGETRQGLSAQVGSFASRNNAERLSGQLRSAGFDAFMHGEESGGRTIWRVRVGIFDERAEAERMLETLRDQEGLDGIVVSHP